MAYFVRCTLRNTAAAAAARALGISTGAHLFAVVDAWEAEDVQAAIHEREDPKTEWGKHTAKALKEAGVVAKQEQFSELLRRAKQDACVFAISPKAAVKLCRPKGAGGCLARLAVPVSSLYQHYYATGPHENSNWGVHGMVRIDKRKVSVKLDNIPDNTSAGRACKAIRGRAQYFVHTHSKSNNL